MGGVEPGGALVVEVGEGAPFQLVLADERPLGVEPALAQLVQPSRRLRDGVDEGAVGGFIAGWPGEGERLEAPLVCVTKATFLLP